MTQLQVTHPPTRIARPAQRPIRSAVIQALLPELALRAGRIGRDAKHLDHTVDEPAFVVEGTRRVQHRITHDDAIDDVGAQLRFPWIVVVFQEERLKEVNSDVIHLAHRLLRFSTAPRPVTDAHFDLRMWRRPGPAGQRNQLPKPVMRTATCSGHRVNDVERHPPAPGPQHCREQLAARAEVPVEAALCHPQRLAKRINADTAHIFFHENASCSLDPVLLIQRPSLVALGRRSTLNGRGGFGRSRQLGNSIQSFDKVKLVA